MGANAADSAAELAPIEEAMGEALSKVMPKEQAHPIQAIAIVMLENQLRKTTDPSAVRALLASLGTLLRAAQERLIEVEVKRPASSRAGYLVPLDQLMPRSQQTWQEEWPQLSAEYYEGVGAPEKDVTWVQQHESLDAVCQSMQECIEFDKSKGWPHEDSVAMNLLSIRRAPMIRALHERIKSGYVTRFSASIHALNDVYIRQAERAKPFGLLPRMYRNLHGHDGLVSNDPQWEHIETPDRNGFRGLCAHGVTKGSCAQDRFDHTGFRSWDGAMVVQDSAVVCFESVEGIEGDECQHNAIRIHETASAYPPNTLFRLMSVSEGGFEAPGGVWVSQKLLTVRTSYVLPKQASDQAMGGKICGGVLSYATHEAFVNGLEDIIELPVLMMAQEFERHYEWTDWKGVRYDLKTEWEYVTGPASMRNATPGRRDAHNEGMTPQDFLQLANDRIAARRMKAQEEGAPVLLEDEFAFLTLEEVLAVRLYSGPSYQPLNDFLRQVALLRGQIRRDTVHSPALTFSATIGHICSAIRKLAAATDPAEADSPLYRGIRGELPRGTWVPNASGLVCVVDTAFMSTSKNRSTPIEYMGGGSNVLWELAPRTESDVAFHRGADIKMLSQFAAEDEVLFPPCTMLVIKKKPADSGSGKDAPGDFVQQMLEQCEAKVTTEQDHRFLAVQVVPHFV